LVARTLNREHRRAKTDRLDTELLKRAFLGWLRGERDHCKMVAIPTVEDEDAKRPSRVCVPNIRFGVDAANARRKITAR
jgi:hypothetical protein